MGRKLELIITHFIYFTQMSVLQLGTYPSRLIRRALKHVNPRNPVVVEAYRFILQEEVSSCQHVANYSNYDFVSDECIEDSGASTLLANLTRAREVLAQKFVSNEHILNTLPEREHVDRSL